MNNGYVIAYPSTLKDKVIELRNSGFSLGEIAKKYRIAKSTISLWVNATPLNKASLEKIAEKRLIARIKGLQTIHKNRVNRELEIKKMAKEIIFSLNLKNPHLCKVLCSLLYWGEGSKTGYRTAFISSDPIMIATYLKLLRRSFTIDETKFRALVHVHEYHIEPEIRLYWSNLTSIPLSQFTKSYLKPHTKKTIRPGYKGAIRIAYYDSRIVNELKAIYNTLATNLGV